ncbi:MAG: hypothetical protein MR711_08670 [Selenomonas sp.]|uniref:DUF5672 family protein n=1 Tax=Selenomonas sp. TaxID=2053611 RepID=UPI0025F282A7|nr:DUF5672 family protein [Selenomonas sp.]MCI6086302.1 hypothetical protein [Selenomonas sp.]
MKEVVVVVPVYREERTLFEQVSLNQLHRVLGRYPIVLLAPERLRGFLQKTGERAEFFPNEDFEGRLAYSRLMLSERFYERFLDYEYLLIYQLDAFVFHGNLSAFCARGFDYWGAPMPYSYWTASPAHIGNGGFSLRRVRACLDMTRRKTEIYERTGLQDVFEASEDCFWGYCGKHPALPFTVPSVREALTFAIEFDVAHVWRKIKQGQFPFGCHAWPRSQYFALWRPLIAPCVDKETMDAMDAQAYENGRFDYYEMEKERMRGVLFTRLMERPSVLVREEMHRMLPVHEMYFLWGNGRVGQEARALLTRYGYENFCLLDARASDGQMTENGIRVTTPSYAFQQFGHQRVLITTTKYEDEIAGQLMRKGYSVGRDFFGYKEFKKKLIEHTYEKIWTRMHEA